MADRIDTALTKAYSVLTLLYHRGYISGKDVKDTDALLTLTYDAICAVERAQAARHTVGEAG